MKRFFIFLLVVQLLPLLSPAAIHVYEGGSSSGSCSYTYVGGKVRKGKSTTGTILYVFQGRKIWEGATASGQADYMIDGSDRLYRGDSVSGSPLFKLASNKIYKGGSTGGTPRYNLSGRTFREGSSSGGKALYHFDGSDEIPAELLFLLAVLSDSSGSGGEDSGVLKVYRGNYASGAPLYTLKNGHLFHGQFTSGASAYTFDGSKIYEGNYASGAADYIHDGEGRFYVGQFLSGAPDYRYDAGKVYRGQYVSGAAAFVVKGPHLYRGQYASGAAAYTFSATMAIPDSLIYFLTAIVEDAADVRTVTPGGDLTVGERQQIRSIVENQTGVSGSISVHGDIEDISASLALGILPEISSGRAATFHRPRLSIGRYLPGSGSLDLQVTPGAGGSFDPRHGIRTSAVHLLGASSLEQLLSNPTSLPIESISEKGAGAMTLRFSSPDASAHFLRVSVQP